MEMFAAVIRDKYAEKDAADGRTTYNIAIMPCTAKKMEAARPEFVHNGRPDVDLVLTTRELVDMIRETVGGMYGDTYLRCALVLLVGWILWKPMGKYIRGDDIKALRGDGK